MVDPNQSFFDVRTMSERIEGSLWQRRAAGSLFMAFAVIALLLAAVGLYSVLSFTVAQQRREIGLRMALGAQRVDIYRLVLSQGLRLTAPGLAVGLVSGAGLSRSMASLTFGIAPLDAATFIGVPLALTVLAAAACFVPARRATRVDPLVALRTE
jgi:ABC-type antimicrobial peptide transport system permease subunit